MGPGCAQPGRATRSTHPVSRPAEGKRVGLRCVGRQVAVDISTVQTPGHSRASGCHYMLEI